MNVEYITVYKDSAAYTSFPSIVARKDGSLLVAFRKAGALSLAAAHRKAPTHHDRDSRICLVTSKDHGHAWSPNLLSEIQLSDCGVNDPAVSQMSDGELLLRFTAIDVVPDEGPNRLKGSLLAQRKDLQTVSGLVGNYISRSSDAGETWSPPKLVEAGELTHTASREQVLELQDRSLLLSVYQSTPDLVEKSWLLRSCDRGETWQALSLIAEESCPVQSPGRINYNETAILPLDSRRLIAMIRSDSSYTTEGEPMTIGGVGELQVSFSEDNGKTWLPPRPSGIWGQPPHLIRCKNGSILCTYGYRRKPY
jgi:hypothetical protein